MKISSTCRNLRLCLALFTAAAALSLGDSSNAATTWNNNAVADFNTAGDWSNGLPSTSNPAVFSSTESVQPNVSGNISVSQLQFAAGGYDITATNSAALTLTSTSSTAASAAIYLDASTTGVVNTLDSSLSLVLVTTGSTTSSALFSGAGTNETLNVNSIMSGSGGLAYGGIGTYNITGANTYNGGTSIYGTSGSLFINFTNAQAFGSGAITFRVGQLDNTSSGTLTLTNAFSINGALTYAGSTQSLILSGTGTLTNTSTSTPPAATDTIAVAAQTVTVTGVISGSTTATNNLDTTLSKTGAGTLVLNGNNTFTGPMTATAGTLTLNGTNQTSGVAINGATLNVNNAGALGASSSTLTVSGSSTVDNTSGTAITVPNSVALNNTLAFSTAAGNTANNLTFSGTASINNSRTITLNGAGSLTFSGGLVNTTTNGYGLVVNNGTGTASTTALNLGGYTLATGATSAVTAYIGGSASTIGTGNVNVTGAIVDGGSVGNNLTVQSTGTVAFSGTNTYGGTTTLATTGTLLINGANNGTGAINVSSTGKFGGSGSVAGALTIGSSATLTPGSANTSGTIGTFAAGNGLTLNGTYLVDLGTSGSSTDRTNVTGALTLGTASILTVRSLPSNAAMGSVYEILTATSGALTTTFSNAANGATYTDASGDTFTVNYNDFTSSTGLGDVSLTLDSIGTVPEPSTCFAGVLLLGTVLWHHRRMLWPALEAVSR